MLEHDIENLEIQVRAEIARVLGVSIDNLPFQVGAGEVAKIIGVSPGTLPVWRSTGRYDLPFVKSGKNVNYPIFGLVRFIVKRMRAHTGSGNHE